VATGRTAPACPGAGIDVERGFLSGLRELGCVEDRNVLIKRRYADRVIE